jgi:NAD-dependent SIR2 family protein deacetylase
VCKILKPVIKLGANFSFNAQNIDELEESVGLDCSADASGSVLLLHGRASKVYCEDCHSVFPLDDHIEALRQGLLVPCPACTRSASPDRSEPLLSPSSPQPSTSKSTASTSISSNTKKNAREPRRSPANTVGQKGNLHTSTLLYGEALPNADEVRKEIERDIKRAKKGDIILIVGTTLHIRQARELVMKLYKESYDKDTMYWINPTLPDDVLQAEIERTDRDRVPVENYTLLPANHFAAVLLRELILKAKEERLLAEPDRA